jgi:hypothetical protein
VTNIAASIGQRLRNLARERNEDFGLVLTKFGIERVLFRMAQSKYRDVFILKGAWLFGPFSREFLRRALPDCCRNAATSTAELSFPFLLSHNGPRALRRRIGNRSLTTETADSAECSQKHAERSATPSPCIRRAAEK